MAADSHEARTKKALVNNRGQTCPVGVIVLMWGPPGKPPYLVEHRVLDPAIPGGARYEFFEATEADLDFEV